MGDRAPGALVVACLSPTDLRPRVDPLTGAIVRDLRSTALSAADAAALEHALRIADAWSGRVLAVTAGTAAADGVLRDTLALGCDALRVPWPPGEDGRHQAGDPGGHVAELASDERALAVAIATAIERVGAPAAVLCGDRSADRGTGALPAFLAHELGAAQALGLVELRADGDELLGLRRLDAGRRERLRIPRPAVCSVEGAGVRLRRASLPATIAASDAAIPLAAATGAPPSRVAVRGVRAYRPRTRVVPAPAGGTPHERLMTLSGAMSSPERATIVGPVDAGDAADALLEFLRRHGYLDGLPPARP